MTGTSDTATLGLLSDSGRTVSSDEEDIRGRNVTDSDGTGIGHVADLLVDEREHQVRLLLVEHGGFLGLGRSKTLIPVDDITAITADDVRIDHTVGHVSIGPGCRTISCGRVVVDSGHRTPAG